MPTRPSPRSLSLFGALKGGTHCWPLTTATTMKHRRPLPPAAPYSAAASFLFLSFSFRLRRCWVSVFDSSLLLRRTPWDSTSPPRGLVSGAICLAKPMQRLLSGPSIKSSVENGRGETPDSARRQRCLGYKWKTACIFVQDISPIQNWRY